MMPKSNFGRGAYGTILQGYSLLHWLSILLLLLLYKHTSVMHKRWIVTRTAIFGLHYEGGSK